MNRRALLMAILVYVTLDLSLPTMPGAFVFEPADSVEGTHARGRQAPDVTVLPPTPTGYSFVPSPSRIDLRHRLPPLSDIVRLTRSAARFLPRAICVRSPLAEDPH